MKRYWITATTKSGDKVFTTNPLKSKDECIEQLSIWKDFYHYEISEAWIECEGTIEYLEI